MHMNPFYWYIFSVGLFFFFAFVFKKLLLTKTIEMKESNGKFRTTYFQFIFQDDKLKCLKSENIHIFFNLSEKTLGFGKNADTTLFLIFKKTLNDYKIMCGIEAVLKMQVQSQEGLLCVLKITEPIVGKIYEIQILSN